MVTASMFEIHKKAKNFLLVLVIGYFGSIGIATLSDSVVPYIGESLLDLHVPTHTELHSHGGEEHSHKPNEITGHDHETHGVHLGFIEEWYIVNPAAVLGVLIAFFIPRTKFPHAFHVLISTWASSAHILMNLQNGLNFEIIAGIFVVLFIAVWLPCCISDIVFPLLFVKSDIKLTETCACQDHARHSHPHEHKHSQECPQGNEDLEESQPHI